MTLSDGLFSASDLRLMELELLCTLKWHLNPPSVHESIHNLLVLFSGSHEDVAAVGRRALRYADLVRSDVEFLKYPPSMIAVASVICALKEKGVAVAVVSDWMRRVHDCHLPYTDRADAAHSITECGLRLIALDRDGPLGRELGLSSEPVTRTLCASAGATAHVACDVDLEVEHATNAHPPPAAVAANDDEASDEQTEASDVDRTSPNNVMDVDQIEAFTNGSEPLFASKRQARPLAD